MREQFSQGMRESESGPSSVRVRVTNDWNTSSRHADEIFVYARMFSGDNRRGLTPADDDGRQSGIQKRRENSRNGEGNKNGRGDPNRPHRLGLLRGITRRETH